MVILLCVNAGRPYRQTCGRRRTRLADRGGFGRLLYGFRRVPVNLRDRNCKRHRKLVLPVKILYIHQEYQPNNARAGLSLHIFPGAEADAVSA